MKKMMMVLAALSCAAGVQAAQINWGNSATASAIYALDGVTKLTSANATAANFAIYLIDANTDLAIADTLSTTASINSKSAGALTGASDGYVLPTQYTTGASFYIMATATFNGTDYYMLIYKNNTADTYWTTTATLNTGTDTFSWTAGTYGGVGTAGDVGVWIPVPEPTSMALLALGAAALGLRRKFRK